MSRLCGMPEAQENFCNSSCAEFPPVFRRGGRCQSHSDELQHCAKPTCSIRLERAVARWNYVRRRATG
eukprot:1625074-Pyramimonas_sp.AAC.1